MNTPTPSSIDETKKSTPPSNNKDALKGFLVILFIISFVVWLLVGGESNTAEVSAPQDNAAEHYSFVLDFVKSKASHPSTVEFCSMFNKIVKTETEPDGSQLHAYRNCMTAKNSYGTELTYDWVVVLHEKKDGSLEVVNWDIKED